MDSAYQGGLAMKAILQWGSGMVAVLLFVSTSHAYDWASPVFKWPIQTVPDACGPGWYNVGPCGMVYGPNYYVVPPCMPFNGLLPGPGGGALMQARQGIPPWMMQGAGGRGPGGIPLPPTPVNTPVPPGTPQPPLAPGAPVPDHRTYTGVYPSHPYIRSPRDFFMWNEELEDMRGRDIRPNLVIPR
jgi:hypothetical protein